jgi:predicted O-methyltransferase YrrM
MQTPNPEMTRVLLQSSTELERRSSMTPERWAAVDRYVADLLVPGDAALESALAANAAAGLPAHDVSRAQGRLLEVLARMRGARRILEIGTLGGYSTIWLARGMAPGGRLVTLEREPRYAEVARANVARAGLADVVEVRVGRALETLPVLAAEDGAPFDLVFVDADKQSSVEYAEWATRLTAPGGVILFDNVVRDGALSDATSDRPARKRRAGAARAPRRRGRRARDDDPDGRCEGLRRVHARGRHGMTTAADLRTR